MSEPLNTLDQQETKVPEGYISRKELEAILEQRDEAFRKELDAKQAALEKAQNRARALVTTPIATHGGGPGVDNHRESWSLAEQEMARAGNWQEHWGDQPEE